MALLPEPDASDDQISLVVKGIEDVFGGSVSCRSVDHVVHALPGTRLDAL
jgi:hypothetical protein